MTKFNVKNIIRSRLPCLQWMPHYTKDDLQSDLIAGFTVGLTVIPQSLAYADLAGLPVQYGLYSSFMGSFLYTFLGTSKDITLGPTAIMALLISEYCQNVYGDSKEGSDPVMAGILCFLTSIILFLMAIFNVGFLVNFIPHCVIVGFCCSAAILISSSQVKNLLGIRAKVRKPFFDQWKDIFANLGKINKQDVIMGIISIIVLKFLQIAKQKYCEEKPTDSKNKKLMKKVLWFCSTARNAIVVIFATAIAYNATVTTENEVTMKKEFDSPFKLTGSLKEGLPAFGLPAMSRVVPADDITFGGPVKIDGEICYPYCNEPHHRDYLKVMTCPVEEVFLAVIQEPEVSEISEEVSTELPPVANVTEDAASREARSLTQAPEPSGEKLCSPTYENRATVTFGDLVSKISSGLIIIPVMAYLESVAIAKGFSKKFGYKVDPTQELYAISVCNFFTALVQGFPVTGSFSRSAVNAASNVKTPAGGIITGLMVVLSSQFLTPVFAYVPKSALSAVIFLAAISMFDDEGIKHVWSLCRIDIFPLMVTFLLCFYEVAIGIGAGVLVALIIMLYSHARPKVKIDKFSDRGLIVRLDRNLDYPACDYVENKIMESRFETQEFLLVDLSKFTQLDSGAAEQMHSLTTLKNIKTQEKLQVFFCSGDFQIRKVLLKAHVPEDSIFEYDWKQVLIEQGFWDLYCEEQRSRKNSEKEYSLTAMKEPARPSALNTEAYSDLVGNICLNEVSPQRKHTNSVCGAGNIVKILEQEDHNEKGLLAEVDDNNNEQGREVKLNIQ